MNDPDQVFEDVMRYSEGKVPPPDTFNSRSELVAYLEEANSKMHGNSIAFMTDTKAAESRIFDKKERTVLSDLRKQKPRIHSRQGKGVLREILRSNRARLKDEATTKNLLPTTNKNFTKWRLNPERFDFRGLDTKSHETIRAFIRQKTREEKSKGRRVFNDRDVYVVSVGRGKKGNVYVKNVLTGQFASKRVYERFGIRRRRVKR